MRRFAALFDRLDSTTSTLAKVAAMAEYFREAPPADAAWAAFFLSGRRFKRLIAPSLLRTWAIDATGLPPWLFEDSYAAAGDLADTVALLLGRDEDETREAGERGETGLDGRDDGIEEDAAPADVPLHVWVEQRILPLREADEDERREQVIHWWSSRPPRETFLLAKLLTGALRVGVSQTLTVRALAQVSGLETATLTHRLMGDWQPSAASYEHLLDPASRDEDQSKPYPFFLASPVDPEADLLEALGPLDDWQVEWKWDGIRGQLVCRGGEAYLWSRGEELVTARFPEIAAAADALGLDETETLVLDGEILAWRDGAPLPFATLQKRIGRKKPGKKTLRDAPVTFLLYDLLEEDGVDLRERPMDERRARLEARLGDSGLPLSERVEASDWTALAALREESRSRGTEGFMLKRRTSPYRVGRRRGDWWKWKVDPLTIDAVMVYAQAGHGRRANLFTDYTFAVWKGEDLVPIAKAYSGLEDKEIRRLDHWIRRNTRERFGPVRSVEAEQVFELGFEGIQRSTRHKSGLATRFPRILRWREDLGPRDADTLESLHEMLDALERA